MQKRHPEHTKKLKNTKRYYGPVAYVFDSARTGTWRVVRPTVNQEKCIACGTCKKFCPVDIITIDKSSKTEKVKYDFTYCKGCGICSNVCPVKCIEMVKERGEQK